MAGVAGGSLAFETCRAGGMGFIAAGHLAGERSFQNLEREIKIFRGLEESSSLSLPLCIGFIGFSTFGSKQGWDLVQRILETHKPSVVQLFAPAVSASPFESSFENNVGMCQSFGCKVIAQVGSVADGIEALDAGVDCLVAQGMEAGG